MNYRVGITSEVTLPESEKIAALITRCACAALEQEGAPDNAAVDVTVVDSDTIRQINAEQRAKDVVTDVLSFPMLEFYNGEWPEDVEFDRNPEDGTLFLGDMILNYDRACEQAEEFGHSVERECGFLTVHSMLHLVGYDHERSEDERRLQREHEESVLEHLGLTRPEE